MSAAPASSRSDDHLLRGIALRLGYVCFISIMYAFMKLASDAGASTVEIIFYRNLFGLPLLMTWIIAGPGLAAARMKRPIAHVTRTAIGLGSLGLNVTALAMMSLADATAFGFMAPLFSTLLSALFLGETVGRHRWFALALGLIGVIVIVQPGGSDIAPLAVAVALGAAFGVASVTVTVRQIAAKETATAIVLWFGLFSMLALIVPLLLTGRAHAPHVWLLFVVVGLAGATGQMCMTASLRFAPVSTLAPLDYLQLLWATGLGWMLWSAEPRAGTIAGAALIAAGGIYTIHREHRLHRERIGASPPAA